MARPCGSWISDFVFGSKAVMRRREAQVQPDQGWRLFERSEFSQTPAAPSIAVRPRSGPTNPARLLFAYFFLAKQEKVSRPPGRDPACLGCKSGSNKTTASAATKPRQRRASRRKTRPPNLSG